MKAMNLRQLRSWPDTWTSGEDCLPVQNPHMGWNHLELNGHSPLLAGVPERSSVYFVHSYMACTESANVTAYCDYGVKIPALAEKGTVFGAQFHPEKSGETGLTILKNFGGLTR